MECSRASIDALRPEFLGAPDSNCTPSPPSSHQTIMSQPIFHGTPNSAIIGTESIMFTVFGDPLALQRVKVGSGRFPSVASPGNNGIARRYHHYSPSSKFQTIFISAMKQTFPDNQALPTSLKTGNCCFFATFYFARPMHHFSKDGRILEKHRSSEIQCKKADVDNLIKFVLDCLQRSCVVDDDWRFVSIHAEKCWSNETRVNVNGKQAGLGAVSVKVQLYHDNRTNIVPIIHHIVWLIGWFL